MSNRKKMRPNLTPDRMCAVLIDMTVKINIMKIQCTEFEQCWSPANPRKNDR
jgi:hypothetical protein